MLTWIASLIPATVLASAAGVVAASQNSGIAVAAVIAGVFMLVNSVLTIWLTNKLTRSRRRDEATDRRSHKR